MGEVNAKTRVGFFSPFMQGPGFSAKAEQSTVTRTIYLLASRATTIPSLSASRNVAQAFQAARHVAKSFSASET